MFVRDFPEIMHPPTPLPHRSQTLTSLLSGLLLLLACLAPGTALAQNYGIANRPSFSAFNGGVLPQTAPTFSGSWAAVLAYPSLTFLDPLGIAELPGQTPSTRRMVVWEREGRIYSFPKNSTATNADKVLLLDLSNQCQGWDDEGLLGFAFHPNFANNHYIFVFYNWVTPGSVVGSPTTRPANATSTHQRLARYTYNPATGTLDPASEYIILDQTDHNTWHNGGGMFFHPTNGYLYLTNGNDQNDTNNQTISRAFFGCVLRLDVDKKGGTISHPPTKRALEEVGPNWPNSYYVPNDNPFVGTANALEEIFALGLRSPHRMNVDPGTGRIYIGDVGEGTWEEVNVMQPNESGLNFQWKLKEGANGELTAPYIGVSRQPIYAYSHASNGGSSAIVGGFVYRGSEFASDLAGRYIFGDNISRNVWYLDETVDPPVKVPLCTVPKGPGPNSGADYTGLSSFGVDADGELYMCQLSSNMVANPAAGTGGQIYKLSRSGTQPPQMPATLSATGLFSNLATLQPIGSFVPYEVNTPLWSDNAKKSRWFAIPTGQTIGFVDSGEWTFPNGTVFLKHFELPTNDNDPSVRKRLETRVLVRDSQGDVYGASYKWRADNSDADIVYAGFNEDVAISGASQLGPTLTSIDIGAQVTNTSTTAIAGGYEITVQAGDIWNNADSFRFLYQQQTGDFDVKYRAESLTQPDLYAKLGIMARATLDAASPHVFAMVFPSNAARNNNNGGYEYQYRVTAGGASAALYPKNPPPLVNYPNTWLRLKRSGNDFIYYWSDNGTTWKEYGRLNQALPSTLYLGVAMTSHTTTASATARVHLDLARTQSWFYPGRQDCRVCHNTNSSGVLGVNTGQFNRTADYATALNGTGSTVTDNQLRAMNHAGYFSPALTEGNIPGLTKLYAISDTTATVEQRMRSYLDANCSQCHRPSGVQAFWDARIETSLGSAGIINGYVTDNLGIANAKVLAPQDLSRSIMYQRISTATQPYKMPPLAKALVDQDAVTLLEQWIAIATQPPGDPLPTPWTSSDVGAVSAPGNSSFYNGTYILSSTSTGPGGTADSMQGAEYMLTGDGELTALVSSLTNTNAAAVAGVMVRETMDPNAREACTLLTPGQGVHFNRRRDIGGGTFDTTGPNVIAPYWIKIRRRGPTVESFSSADGVTWSLVGSDTIAMGPNVYFCLVMASADPANEGTATFDNVTMAPGVFGGGAQVTINNAAANGIAWHTSTIAGPSVANQSVGWYANDQILFTGTGAPVALDGPTDLNTGTLTIESTAAGNDFSFTGGTLKAAQIRAGNSDTVGMGSTVTGTDVFFGALTTDATLGPIGQGTINLNTSPTHTGTLTINNGVLNVNGANVNLSSGLAVAVNGSGARIAPGAYPFDSGLLRAGLLEISGGSGDQIGSQTITLNGGTLLFNNAQAGNQTNTVQNVKLGLGGNTVLAAAQGATTADILAVTNLNRTAGATAEFRSVLGALGGSGNVGRVTIGNLDGSLAANRSGLVGGWATVGSGTATASAFATFGANGVVAATPDRATNSTGGTINNASLSGGTSTQNWTVNGGLAAAGTIAANTSINSLIGSSDVIINSGAQLTLTSGGLIMKTGSFWLKTTTGATGKLTTGMASGELFLRGAELYDTANDQRIRVQIANNGSTPLLLIKTGPGVIGLGDNTGTGTVANSYTGGTVIQEGSLKAYLANAFSTGNVTVLPGGQAWITGVTVTNAFTLSGYGAAENAGVLGALKLDNNATVSGTITLASDARVYVASAGTATLSGVISGTGTGLEKTGPGILVLPSPINTFTGDVVVNGGTLRSPTNNVAGGLNANASFGKNISGRTITANAGTTLDWRTNNVFGGAGMNAAGLPKIVLNGATLTATRFNPIGDIRLNGATLTQTTTDTGNYEGYEFIGTITVGGTAPSTISTTNSRANHLRGNATTIFDVADATGNASADLMVTNALRNGSNDYAGTGSLQKEGVGTMQLSAANTYTGTTTVNAGTLLLTGSIAGPAAISAGGALSGTGTVTGATTVSGILAPGNAGIGTLTTGALTLAPGANYQWQLSDWNGTAGTTDVVNVPSLTITSTAASPTVITIQPQALANFSETAHVFSIVHATGAISGYTQNKFVVDSTPLPAAKGFWRVIQGGSDLYLAYTPHIDSDGDGILDDWEVAMTGNTTTMNAGSDGDGDGLNDTLEYALGSSPTNSMSGLNNITHDVEQIGGNSYLRLSVTKNANATNLTYEIVVSGDLLTWGTAQTVIEQNTSTTLIVRDAIPLGSVPQRFIRLRVHP